MEAPKQDLYLLKQLRNILSDCLTEIVDIFGISEMKMWFKRRSRHQA